MNKVWGDFTKQDDEIIYDVTLDKNRQIGASTLVAARLVHEYRRGLIDNVQMQAVETIIEETRHFVVGNTTSSSAKFNSAYSFFLEEMSAEAPLEIREIINMFAKIIQCVKDGTEYVDELIEILQKYSLYFPEDALTYLEA